MVSLREYLDEEEIDKTDNPFCNDCGSLMSKDSSFLEKITEELGEDLEGDIDENFFYCNSCEIHYISGDIEILKTKMIEKSDNFILEDDETGTIKRKCPDCGHDRAYMKDFPPLFGDEDTIVAYQCSSCGKTYRETSMKIK